MPRFATFAVGLLAIVCAAALYGVKHGTRRLESAVNTKERALEKLEADFAVLKSERAYLGRPERIEPLARVQGLAPIREQQYTRIEEPAEDAIARLLEKPEAQPVATTDPAISPGEGP